MSYDINVAHSIWYVKMLC